MLNHRLSIIPILGSFWMGSCQSTTDTTNEEVTTSTENVLPSVGKDVFATDYWNDAALVWSDEFDGSSLSLDNWKYETGNHGWGNNELQNYLNDGNVVVSDGTLKIIAKKEEVEGSNYT